MNVLLDTHAFLWFIAGDSRLSPAARTAIEDPANLKLVSAASLWEIAIKVSLGKLALKQPFEDIIPRQMDVDDFDLLQIRMAHIAKVASLPFHHRDPFDRMLAAQCLTDGLSLVSSDSQLDAYTIKRIW